MDKSALVHWPWAQTHPSPQFSGPSEGPSDTTTGAPTEIGRRGPWGGQASLPQTERSGLTSGHQHAAGTHTHTVPTCGQGGGGSGFQARQMGRWR